MTSAASARTAQSDPPNRVFSVLSGYADQDPEVYVVCCRSRIPPGQDVMAPGDMVEVLNGAVGHMDDKLLRCWKQVKVAPSNKTNKKGHKRAFECSGSIGAPQEEPEEAPKWGPRASQEDPCGAPKR